VTSALVGATLVPFEQAADRTITDKMARIAADRS
jgi:hypothetical protein